jgi:hypothetical protein
MPEEQPQEVGEAPNDTQAQENSESETSSEDGDHEDAVMADAGGVATNATADGQDAMVGAHDESAGQSRRLSRKEKYGNKTETKQKHQAIAAYILTPDQQAHTRGKGRKKKNHGQLRRAPQPKNSKDG